MLNNSSFLKSIFETETVIFLLSILSVLFAHYLEFAGFKPCSLCIYQRYIYYFIIASFLFRPYIKKILLGLYKFCLFIGAGLAIFHVLVEREIISPTKACQSQILLPTDLSLAVDLIENSLPVGCNIPTYIVPFFSLAEMNLIFVIVLLIISFRGVYGITGKQIER